MTILLKIIKNTDVDFILFYSEWCKYSMNAIKKLKTEGKKFKAYKIEKIGMNKLLNNLVKIKDKIFFNEKHKTRPIIFKNSKFIGGFDSLDSNL
jgi:glutaredoxin